MKLSLTILFLTTLLYHGTSQKTATPFFNQLLISINRTFESIPNSTEDRFGFGLGVYHNFLPENSFDFNLGVEFNKTSQFENSEGIGHFAEYLNLTNTKSCIAVPVNLRMTSSGKVKYFLEPGGFWDWVIFSKQKGILHTAVPDGQNQVQETFSKINQKAGLANSFGISFGVGVRIPGKHCDFIIKPVYNQKFNKWYYDKDRVLGKYFRLNLGIMPK